MARMCGGQFGSARWRRWRVERVRRDTARSLAHCSRRESVWRAVREASARFVGGVGKVGVAAGADAVA